ncbi:SCO family protein [Aurantimonas sp. A2-1-M11]|uniref:SCO family protein n=1 Tax=Aurantimonas sp. A2-1-M11 TaxID=3113712 RepID=UPI002F951149
MSGLSMVRAALWATVALIAGAAVALALMYAQGGPGRSGQTYGSSFALVDETGQPFTETDLRGKPTAVFFGFTHCPDVCPTTLYELAGYQKQLSAEGGDLQVVFVTVDPERDTPDVMKSYVEAVSPDIKALTGSPEKVAAMLKGWGVYSRKVGEGDDYTMDHTATTFLIDEQGELAGTLAYGESPDTALAKLERLAGV